LGSPFLLIERAAPAIRRIDYAGMALYVHKYGKTTGIYLKRLFKRAHRVSGLGELLSGKPGDFRQC
jgi:hypothetical protein